MSRYFMPATTISPSCPTPEGAALLEEKAELEELRTNLMDIHHTLTIYGYIEWADAIQKLINVVKAEVMDLGERLEEGR